MATPAKNEYSDIYETVGSSAIQAEPKLEPSPSSPPDHLSQENKHSNRSLYLAIFVAFLMFILASFITLYGNEAVMKTNNEIQTLETEIEQFQHENEVLRESINSQYNYHTVKDYADDNGMVIEESRVRKIGE